MTLRGLIVGLARGALVTTLVACWQSGGDVRTRTVTPGERLYQEGRLTSGELASAVVLGDVPVAGDQTPCSSCHGRSGMGTEEQQNRTPPIAGPLLFAPDPRHKRPAYTEESLARAVRDGVGADGRTLDALMPRYGLGDEDMVALTGYLRSLGSVTSPGADDEHLRIATVIAGDVPDEEREQLLSVLQTFVEVKNAGVRGERARVDSRRRDERALVPYREWTLDVWEIGGDPTTWARQLEARYAEQPVFAMVSGTAAGPWQPIHAFCEGKELPCLLPNTERTPAVGQDFYTLYFSGGVHGEARILASELISSKVASDVVQVVPSGDDAAAEAAAALESNLRAGGGTSRIESVEAGAGGATEIARIASEPASAVVLWVGEDALPKGPDAASGGPPLYFSATQLGGDWEGLPASWHARSHVVDRFRLPTERDPGMRRFQLWARARGLTLEDERRQAQAYFACVALHDGMKHIGRYAQRDYLLDSLDHSTGLTVLMPVYPRPNVGPGQRTLSRGAYVVDLSETEPPRWVVP